jgi:hypothetical protein
MAANSRRIGWLVAFTVLCVVAALVAPSFPQPTGYHGFVDTRAAFGIPNFANVASNIPFLIAGLWGLAVVLGGGARFQEPQERWPWIAFFAGLVLTTFGSAYYHLAPNNETLFCDRLPITIALMALVSVRPSTASASASVSCCSCRCSSSGPLRSSIGARRNVPARATSCRMWRCRGTPW